MAGQCWKGAIPGPVKFEGGQSLFEVDSPTFMGGGGSLPGPMHYCFFGLASCYAAVFATMAAMLGIELKKVKTRVEADINFSRMFALGDQPAIEEVRVFLKALQGFGGRSVLEIVAPYAGDTYRAVYTVRFEDAIYVLHAFQKKSKRGVSIPRKEIDLIKQRLAAAEQDYRERHN